MYTTLILSCKKSEENVWALLARDIDLADPNSNWSPMYAWTNDKALKFQLAQPGAGKQFHKNATSSGVKNALSDPKVEVFAFQEMNENKGVPKNDRAIFSAVTSLMKAQAYELEALPLRKKDPCIYQFNLVSVVDAEMARLMFKENNITCTSIDSEHYLARYIIKKQEMFSRIRFIRSEVFAKELDDYDRLHEANTVWFEELVEEFYQKVFKNYPQTKVFREDFEKAVVWLINSRVREGLNIEIDVNTIYLHWDKEKNQVSIDVFSDNEHVVDFMNQDDPIQKRVKAALKEYYRYSGPFAFVISDVPPF